MFKNSLRVSGSFCCGRKKQNVQNIPLAFYNGKYDWLQLLEPLSIALLTLKRGLCSLEYRKVEHNNEQKQKTTLILLIDALSIHHFTNTHYAIPANAICQFTFQSYVRAH